MTLCLFAIFSSTLLFPVRSMQENYRPAFLFVLGRQGFCVTLDVPKLKSSACLCWIKGMQPTAKPGPLLSELSFLFRHGRVVLAAAEQPRSRNAGGSTAPQWHWKGSIIHLGGSTFCLGFKNYGQCKPRSELGAPKMERTSDLRKRRLCSVLGAFVFLIP